MTERVDGSRELSSVIRFVSEAVDKWTRDSHIDRIRVNVDGTRRVGPSSEFSSLLTTALEEVLPSSVEEHPGDLPLSVARTFALSTLERCTFGFPGWLGWFGWTWTPYDDLPEPVIERLETYLSVDEFLKSIEDADASTAVPEVNFGAWRRLLARLDQKMAVVAWKALGDEEKNEEDDVDEFTGDTTPEILGLSDPAADPATFVARVADADAALTPADESQLSGPR